MGLTVSTALPEIDEATDLSAAPLEPWEVVVWNDPVNLMSYVVRVFRTYFGYTREHATRLMLAVHHDVVPPTINLEDPDDELRVDVPREPREMPVPVAINDSFGFGGHNASLVFCKA